MFRINDLLSCGKFFSDKGVGLTTDGVQVSIHYSKIVSVHPDAKKKTIKSAVARLNARWRAVPVTRIVRQNRKAKAGSDNVGKIDFCIVCKSNARYSGLE